MGSYKICDHVEGEAPPNGSKTVAREILHATQEANGVINFGKILKEEHD